MCFEKSNQRLRISHKNFKHPTTDRLRNFDDCLDLLEKDSHTNQSTNSQSNVMSNNLSLIQIGDILFSMKCFDDAAEYFRLSLQATSENDHENNRASLAKSLFRLGHCLLQMNRAIEAFKCFSQLRNIYEQAVLNEETDTNLAKILFETGHCLVQMNQANEAVEYYKGALKIYEKATPNDDIDTDLAITLREIG